MSSTMDPSRALELVHDRDGPPADGVTAAPRHTAHTGAFALPHQRVSRKTITKTSTKALGTTSKTPLASTASSTPPPSSSPKTRAEPARFATPSGGVRGRFVPGDNEATTPSAKLTSDEGFATPSKANLRRSARPVPSSRSGAVSSSGPAQAPGTRSNQDVDEQDLRGFTYKSITAQMSSGQPETDDPTPPIAAAGQVTTTKVVAAELATAGPKSLPFSGEVEANDNDPTNSPHSSPPGTYGCDEEVSDLAQSQPLTGTQESLATEHDEGEHHDRDEGPYSEDEEMFRNPLSPTPQEADFESQAHPTTSSGAGSQMDSRSSAEFERDSKRARMASHEDAPPFTLDPLCPTLSIFPGASPYLDRARTRVRTMEEHNGGVEERTMTDEQWREKGQQLAARAGDLVHKVVKLMVNKNARAEKHRKDMLTVKAALAREQVELDKSREGLLQWANPVLALSREKGKESDESSGNGSAPPTTHDGEATQADSQND